MSKPVRVWVKIHEWQERTKRYVILLNIRYLYHAGIIQQVRAKKKKPKRSKHKGQDAITINTLLYSSENETNVLVEVHF